MLGDELTDKLLVADDALGPRKAANLHVPVIEHVDLDALAHGGDADQHGVGAVA